MEVGLQACAHGCGRHLRAGGRLSLVCNTRTETSKVSVLIFRDCQFAAFGAKNYVLEISGVTHKTKVLLIVLHAKYMLIYFSGGAHAAQSVVHQSPDDVGG